MPYRPGRETALPIGWDFTGEDAILQRSYFRREFALVFLNALGVEEVWDLTGRQIYMQVKANPDGPVLLDCNTSNGRIIAGLGGVAPDQYSFALELDHTATVGVADWGLGRHDIFYINDAGIPVRLYEGDASLSRNVSS